MMKRLLMLEMIIINHGGMVGMTSIAINQDKFMFIIHDDSDIRVSTTIA